MVNAVSECIQARLEHHPINEQRSLAGLTPANVVLFRGAGQKMHAPRFEDHTGMKGCVLAPTKIIAGSHIILASYLTLFGERFGTVHWTGFD